MLSSFSFNGIRKSFVGVERGGVKSAWAPISRGLIRIPGKAGAYLDSTETDVRIRDVPIFIKATSKSNLRKLEEEITAWLITDEPEELIFDDEPDRIYYAVVEGSLDIEEVIRFGRGVITFVCLDPFKHATEEDFVQFSSGATFNVGGTVKTEPVTKITLAADTTFVAVSDGTNINLIGQQLNAEDTVFVPEELKAHETMDSKTGWSVTNTVEGGVNQGTLSAMNGKFYTYDYGTAINGWRGPALKKSIAGGPLQDFKVEALVEQKGIHNQIGSLEIALLDASNNIVAKMLLTKRSATNIAVWARMTAGNDTLGHNIMNTRGSADWNYQHFHGTIRISRQGNVWNAWIGTLGNDGKYYTVSKASWIDTTNRFTAPITQVQVQLWRYSSVLATNQTIEDIKIYKLNQDSGVPVVAKAGDTIIFDHKNDVILRNGEDITKEKAFIGDYFPLVPGTNSVVVEPAEVIASAEVRWRDKWR